MKGINKLLWNESYVMNDCKGIVIKIEMKFCVGINLLLFLLKLGNYYYILY